MDVTPFDRIVVSRSVEYAHPAPGDPLEARKGGRHQVLEFSWRGRRYRFDQHEAPIVLTIDAADRPVIIAPADDASWHANGYRCAAPFYVQFTPDASGRRWTWPPRIDPVYYGLETNLLQAVPRPGAPNAHLTTEEVRDLNHAKLDRAPQRLRVEPGYVADECRQRGIRGGPERNRR